MSQETETDVKDEPTVKLDAIVERYIALREKLAQMKKAFEEEAEPIKAAMEKVENYLLGQMNSMGVESLSTPFGTPYKSTKTSATVADFSSVLDWAKATNNWDVLTKGVSKDFVKAYREEHNDLPPGVNWREEVVVNIRKK